MRLALRLVVAGSLLIAAVSFTAAVADEPKHGGILKIYHRDSPPSASIHEEATYSTVIPFMPIFNNLVMYKQDVAQNSFQSIVPDLASSWSWSEDKTELTFKLRQGVKWHDGKLFTANDVKCTFDLLMGKSKDSLRKNPRQDWYKNVAEVKVNGEDEVAFHLRRPQPALLALLASGYSPIYPCHVSARDMRVKPIGTGPFKFVEFKQNESIKITRNEDYWKKDRPYLDGIDFTIIPNRSTAISLRSTMPIYAAPWRLRSTARHSSTSSPKAKTTSGAPCCHRQGACGGCHPRFSRRFRVTGPTSRRTARRRAS